MILTSRSYGWYGFIWLIAFVLGACGTEPTVVRVTLAPTQIGMDAPIYTATATFTASPTVTATDTATATATSTATPTATPTPTATDTPTNTPTATPTPSPTPPLVTLTSPAPSYVQAIVMRPAEFSTSNGWSCGDFPCEDDIEGWYERIGVAPGFSHGFVGSFGGQVHQITYGHDGRLYATRIDPVTRVGAVYVMNEDGSTERYSDWLISPIGLAFQPNSDTLYVSARMTLHEGGGLWRVETDGRTTPVVTDLPCCYDELTNQPNGMTFGADGYLYMGIGALTDRGESTDPATRPYDDIHPLEAGILRIHPHTGEVERIASGIRNPYDVTMDGNGRLFATDSGLVTGQGDRLLAIQTGAFYGFPFYRLRGCAECPPTRGDMPTQPDLITFVDYTLPRGLVAYTGAHYPSNLFNTLFVALWNGTEKAQRIAWIDPLRDANPSEPDEVFEPFPFMTGLVRPIDVVQDPHGALVVADSIYGHIWRVTYDDAPPVRPTSTPSEAQNSISPLFATNTPVGN